MNKKRIKEVLSALLETIPDSEVYGNWASWTHGHLAGKNKHGYLPWYYLKYENNLGGEVYNKYFLEYETSKGKENNNFFSNYRYYDADKFESFTDLKQEANKKVENIKAKIMQVFTDNSENSFIEDLGVSCRYSYRTKEETTLMGICLYSEEFLKEVEENIYKQ
jgi:hypothetical protein